jgi:hypothetical protein
MTDIGELQQWQDLCFDGGDNVRLCRERLALLESWYLRVGRSGDFNAAVMNSARIIAATCETIQAQSSSPYFVSGTPVAKHRA